jgi:hypothetical protein
MPQRKRRPLGLISLPNLDILVDPETSTFIELSEGEATLWINLIGLIGRKSGRLVKKDMDDFFRRAHEIGIISDERLGEILNARKGVPFPTIQQYKKVRFDTPGGKPVAHPFSGIGKLRPN